MDDKHLDGRQSERWMLPQSKASRALKNRRRAARKHLRKSKKEKKKKSQHNHTEWRCSDALCWFNCAWSRKRRRRGRANNLFLLCKSGRGDCCRRADDKSFTFLNKEREKEEKKTPGRFTDGEGSIKPKYMSCFSKRNCFLRLVCWGCQSRSSCRPRPPVHQSRTRSRFRTVKPDEFHHLPADYFPPRCIFFFFVKYSGW